jgi:RHS repeat-associated protein
MNKRRALRVVVAAVAAAAALAVIDASAQYCPVATTYFGTNYFGGCTVGSCWAPYPFTGSTSVSGSYPSTNYACATTAPITGQLENTLNTYDNNGNLTTVKDPLTHQTANTFDALNRLLTVLDPNSGTTSYAYDTANNLTQVTDPNGTVTSYTYSGLNDLIQLVSADTGTTTTTYDAAGNLLTKTDARGAVATYTYDVLNRVTQVVYSKTGNPNETHAFTYDSGTNAKGRLSQVVDPAATTAWTYNSQGRVASKTQTVGSVVASLTYGYNSAGQLTSVTTPSGQVIAYTYTNNRVSAVTVNGTSLITGAATEPFGPLAVWYWGNGLKMWRDYDNDGRLITWEFRNGSSILRKDQSFDVASRITAIADPDNPPASQAYQYDVLDRLTVAQTGNPITHTQQFTYDSVGNRQNATLDGSSANLYYNGSNRLQAMIGTVSAGYLNGATALAYTYNNANRLVQIQSNGTIIASYAVSALGQRVSKTVSGVTTFFVYDEQGHLLGEYDGSGNLIQETMWLEDLPVATLRPTGGSGNPTPTNTYYVHADHLGSPRDVTRPSDNALMWQWDNVDPFGANAANTNPAGQGTFTYNVRFPGQYYDVEVGTNYNYYRDYDPAVGRYEQSDPLGLGGGLNTYGYTSDSPLGTVDSLGLVSTAGAGVLPVPTPIQIPRVRPLPVCWTNVLGAFVCGWTIGTIIYPIIEPGLSKLIDDVCRSNPDCQKATPWQLGRAGISNEHAFKTEWGAIPNSRFDICACKDGSIVIKGVGQCGNAGPTIETDARWLR